MMTGFGLLLGHLVGDYIVQNDWMAANKVAFGHDVRKYWADVTSITINGDRYPPGTSSYHNAMVDDHAKQVTITNLGHIACTVHCLCYTLSVWAFSWSGMPWWGLLACFLIHWPIDRFRLARVWMERVSGQKAFANGPLSPWSIIIVDNTFHLLTLWVIALIAGQP